uniref:Keratin, type I cytoskeletal 18 n=1 Tax=Protopterus aethiopicus TaxID=7886 RepID=K1C18_PROAT|nr:RecName: Full=Keratin, type I cytoskeletal 18; AltName: Full=Cytokeratin-18; Short=CK-18; AltName: Full=Keratin-18; Short=K18 [Protopterus aethiopicus]CAH05048.1 type I keratin 18 [Protopterus aethiopicus]
MYSAVSSRSTVVSSRPLSSSRSLVVSSSYPKMSTASTTYSGVASSGSRISSTRYSTIGSALGGAGGFGTRSSLTLSGNAVISNEKETMQDLNDRLSNYLETVRRLENANQQLEIQIREAMEKRGPSVRDYSNYEKIIKELRDQIYDTTVDNARLVLAIDNARLAADDFRVKWEAELAIRQSVDSDINGLRKVIDDTNLGRLQLESEIEVLKEELVFIKKNHEDEVIALRNQVNSCGVQVDLDAPKGTDLAEIMATLRAEYEAMINKNKDDAEHWYQSKVETFQVETVQNTEALQTAKTELSDLRRRIQSLEIELESNRSMRASLEDTLRDTELRYAMEMERLGALVSRIEAELAQVRTDMQRQAQDYEVLLNAKMKLEAEIATYRHLLGGEDSDTLSLQDALSAMKVSNVQTVQKIVVTTQKLVDGKVVEDSTVTETK